MCRRNNKCFVWSGCMPSNSLPFSFLFVDVCWLDDKVKVLFGMFSYRLYNTGLDGTDLLKIGPVNACEMALKNDEVMWKTLKSDCAVTWPEKSERKFLKLAFAERRKIRFKTAFKSNETAVTSGYPDAPFTRVRRAPGHPDNPPLKSFSNSSW